MVRHMKSSDLKIGELARRAGVSVRTLHHYDDIGLLEPTVGGGGSQRHYGPAAVARLHQIRSLQALGLSLEEIRGCLDSPENSPLDVIERHLRHLDDELDLARRLKQRLETIACSLRSMETPSTEDLLRSMETMSEFEKYYTPEQLKKLAERKELVGEERIQQVQQEWQDLFAEFRAAMARGEDPGHPTVRELAKKAAALIEEFTGGDPGIYASLSKMYASEPSAGTRVGMEPELGEYMSRARAALSSGTGDT